MCLYALAIGLSVRHTLTTQPIDNLPQPPIYQHNSPFIPSNSSESIGVYTLLSDFHVGETGIRTEDLRPLLSYVTTVVHPNQTIVLGDLAKTDGRKQPYRYQLNESEWQLYHQSVSDVLGNATTSYCETPGNHDYYGLINPSHRNNFLSKYSFCSKEMKKGITVRNTTLHFGNQHRYNDRFILLDTTPHPSPLAPLNMFADIYSQFSPTVPSRADHIQSVLNQLQCRREERTKEGLFIANHYGLNFHSSRTKDAFTHILNNGDCSHIPVQALFFGHIHRKDVTVPHFVRGECGGGKRKARAFFEVGVPSWKDQESFLIVVNDNGQIAWRDVYVPVRTEKDDRLFESVVNSDVRRQPSQPQPYRHFNLVQVLYNLFRAFLFVPSAPFASGSGLWNSIIGKQIPIADEIIEEQNRIQAALFGIVTSPPSATQTSTRSNWELAMRTDQIRMVVFGNGTSFVSPSPHSNDSPSPIPTQAVLTKATATLDGSHFIRYLKQVQQKRLGFHMNNDEERKEVLQRTTSVVEWMRDIFGESADIDADTLTATVPFSCAEMGQVDSGDGGEGGHHTNQTHSDVTPTSPFLFSKSMPLLCTAKWNPAPFQRHPFSNHLHNLSITLSGHTLLPHNLSASGSIPFEQTFQHTFSLAGKTQHPQINVGIFEAVLPINFVVNFVCPSLWILLVVFEFVMCVNWVVSFVLSTQKKNDRRNERKQRSTVLQILTVFGRRTQSLLDKHSHSHPFFLLLISVLLFSGPVIVGPLFSFDDDGNSECPHPPKTLHLATSRLFISILSPSFSSHPFPLSCAFWDHIEACNGQTVTSSEYPATLLIFAFFFLAIPIITITEDSPFARRKRRSSCWSAFLRVVVYISSLILVVSITIGGVKSVISISETNRCFPTVAVVGCLSLLFEVVRILRVLRRMFHRIFFANRQHFTQTKAD